MEVLKNIEFVNKIDISVKKILKDGKVDQYDIPELVFLITDLSVTTNHVQLSQEELVTAINGLYEYIMSHYNLFPDNEEQKNSFKKLFDMSVKLVLFQPNVKSCYNKFFSCFSK